MKRSVSFFSLLVALLAFALAGCTSADMSIAAQEANQDAIQQGLPFRWQVKSGTLMRYMLPLPSAHTRADASLQQSILARISESETRDGRNSARLADVKRLRDGREVWLLASADTQGIAYIVIMRPNTRGGVDLGLSEPILFVK